MKAIKELCDVVRETAYAIHVYHGHGHLEKVVFFCPSFLRSLRSFAANESESDALVYFSYFKA